MAKPMWPTTFKCFPNEFGIITRKRVFNAELKRVNVRSRTAKIAPHKHEIVSVDGNNLLCKCGALVGFVRDPKQYRLDIMNLGLTEEELGRILRTLPCPALPTPEELQADKSDEPRLRLVESSVKEE